MKQIAFYIICLVAICMLNACGSKTEKTAKTAETVETEKVEDVAEENDSTEEEFLSLVELNEVSYDEMETDADSIENDFQKLAEALPQYKANLIREKAAWEKYQDAVREVAGYVDRGSSTPMYVSDVLGQGLTLRRTSFRNLLLHIQGRQISAGSTSFTDAMIADAYSAFTEAAGRDEYLENKTGYQKSLRKSRGL